MWGERETVILDGEFLHPGVYSIIPGETFFDVIKRAGGLNVRAFPEGTIFSRAGLRQLEAERLESLKKEVQFDIAASQLESSNTRDAIDVEQANKIIENIDSTRPLGRMVIDLTKILSNPELHDFELLDGDTITVPRYKPSVTVVGEVQYPTSHFFDEKLNVKDYLERSGGLKFNADKKRIYVVKANGRVFRPKNRGWFKRSDVELNPGDTIIVPLDTTRVDKLTVWASVTRIMYEAALGVAALSSL
jgi:protein involved in polysaccharide export with SLBB domain